MIVMVTSSTAKFAGMCDTDHAVGRILYR